MKYVAYDGTEFHTEEACEKYEETLASRLVGDIRHKIVSADEMYDGSSFNLYVFFKINYETEVPLFEKWVNGFGIKCDARKYLGETVVVDCYCDMDDTLDGIVEIYSINTIDECILKYAKRLRAFAEDF